MESKLKKILKEYHQIGNCQLKFRLLIIKLYLQDHTGTEIAEILDISKSSVYHWINKYREEDIDGLRVKEREGRPRELDYERLESDLRNPPTYFGFNSSRWTANLIKRHIRQTQNIEISSSHVYAVLSKIGLSLRCNGINCSSSRDLQTVRGDLITPLHLEVLSEATIMLDAPITRIITSSGIKPELKVVSQSKDKVVLKGTTEAGELTLTYEESRDQQ